MKIKYNFNVKSRYKKSAFEELTNGFKLNEIKKAIPEIQNTLLEIDEVRENACFYPFKFKSLSFDILFTNDDEIQSVNAKYRNKDVPTDVITFALFADDDFKMVLDDDIYLGEILISLDTAKRQAKEGVKKEILTLLCHGFLHLFGFDHQTDKDYNFITQVQNRVIKTVSDNKSD